MYYLINAIVWVLSKIPMKGLYVLSDFIFLLVFYITKYRRRVVADNLRGSFPEKDEEYIKKIEREFYHFFSDYIVETIKMRSISEQEIRQRMEFVGIEKLMCDMKQNNKMFAFIYLAHYGNWEWVASMNLHIQDIDKKITGAQIYHPLRNKAFNRLFLKMRGQFGGKNIPMKETLRYIINARKNNQPTIIGFIADQTPKWNSIHHWTNFLHRKTPVFIGTEQLGKRVDALIYYAHMVRIKRGYYRCYLSKITDNVNSFANYDITDKYFELLEESIQAHPAFWLWTHKRWKRTYEEFLKREANKQ